MKPRARLLLVGMVLAIYLLHQDFWNWKKVEPLVFGFLPIGLAYHGGYSVLAAVMMWVLVKFAWPKELDAMESGRDDERDAKP
ncbi:MAG TPA: DUF3311 domain-containing protein [Verrucomicrobiae bacterium]